MLRLNGNLSGEHRAMLRLEYMYAGVVLFVVGCATALSAFKPQVISSDLLSAVYGGAISFAVARGSGTRGALVRRGDDAGGNDG